MWEAKFVKDRDTKWNFYGLYESLNFNTMYDWRNYKPLLVGLQGRYDFR